MKKTRKLITSVAMLMLSISILMVGIYAASQPTVTISGTISYNVGVAKVEVWGKLSNAYTSSSGTAKSYSTMYNENGQVATGGEYHYYGKHDNAQSETNLLPEWNIGDDLILKETNDGAEPLILTFTIKNLSSYSISTTANGSVDETANMTRVVDDLQTKSILPNASATLTITYSVTDLTKASNINLNDVLTFQKASTDSDIS